MTSRAAYIISLKYSPGLRKLFETVGSGLSERGIPVGYIASARYSRLGPTPEGFRALTEAESPVGILRETASILSAPGPVLRGLFPAGRHKSWVCRRLSLVERLCDEALEHMRLGLIRGVTGRELARLPRGNQAAALRTILKYRFSSRESARLISLLLSRPQWKWQDLLNFPAEILSDRAPERPCRRDLLPLEALTKKLLDLNQGFLSISEQCDEDMLFAFRKEEWGPVYSALEKVRESLDSFKRRIDGIRMRAE